MNGKDLIATAVMAGMAAGTLWTRIPPAATMSSPERERIERSVTYSGCNEVRALGRAPIRAGEPGYRIEMDGDGDGLACEPIRR